MSHTPGPWIANKGATNAAVNGAWGDVEECRDDFSICTIWADVDELEACATANANLIAAAPDLLEAAKHAAMEWRLHGSLTDSCRVLESAITKAEGR